MYVSGELKAELINVLTPMVTEHQVKFFIFIHSFNDHQSKIIILDTISICPLFAGKEKRGH